MKRTIAIALAFLAGICLLAYPSVASYVSDKNGSWAVQAYGSAVDEADQEALSAEWDEAVAYNESLSGNPVHDPFLEGSGMAMQDNYYEVLDLTDAMATVEIPRISVSLPVYHGTAESVLQRGAGHLEGSSVPIGGEGSHAVITGHTGLAHARMFTDLAELEEGDLFYLHVLDKTLAYQVDQVLVVEPEDTEALKRAPGEDLCTLLTCTPYGVNSHRLLVRGHRTDYSPEAKEAIEPVAGSTGDAAVVATACGAAAVTAVCVALAVSSSRRRERRRQELIDTIASM